jgi:hypothetical protein
MVSFILNVSVAVADNTDVCEIINFLNMRKYELKNKI